MTQLDNLTPTERRFHDLLSDGHGHEPSELHSLLWDEQSDRNGFAVSMHVSNLRKKLPAGQDIMMRNVAGRKVYQIVRVTADPFDGRS